MRKTCSCPFTTVSDRGWAWQSVCGCKLQTLSVLNGHGCQLDPMRTSYFLSRDTVIPSMDGGMAYWREKLFAQLHRNASGAADFLNLPNNAGVELGSKMVL